MKRILTVFKNIGIVILAMLFGNIIMMGLLQLSHTLFGGLEGFDPTAPYLERLEQVNAYLDAHPAAVYMIFLEHALGAAAGVYLATKLSAPRRKFRQEPAQRSNTAPIIVGVLYLVGTITNDMVTVPMAIYWGIIDVVLVACFCFLAFWLAGGLKKQSATTSVTSEEETYRG